MTHRHCVTGRQPTPLVFALGLVIVGACLLLPATSSHASALRRSAFVRAIERAKPAVVSIHGNKVVGPSDTTYGISDQPRKVNGMGTGVVIDPRGYIVTNYHVVEGVARIQVSLADGRTTIARLIAHDRPTDLAIIKVDTPEPLTTIPLGTSRDLMHGEDVIAIGNAYGYSQTVTRGIISALHRRVEVSDVQYYDDLIQTDASINPGNSGGPLLNIDGEMIGINAAVRMEAQGIGFAIPVDTVVEVAARLINPQQINGIQHGLVLAEQREGSVVASSVRPDSPAAQAGVQPGDYIQAIDGQPVARRLDVHRALLDKKPGDQVALQIERGADTVQLVLELASAKPQSAPRVPTTAWDLLGLHLEPISAAEFARYRPAHGWQGHAFQGGLRVLSVRPQSPAQQQQIRPGDILLGLYNWETMTLEHVEYILGEARQTRPSQLLFYVLRDGETLTGQIEIAWSKYPSTTRR